MLYSISTLYFSFLITAVSPKSFLCYWETEHTKVLSCALRQHAHAYI
jgi:hypothetical protein